MSLTEPAECHGSIAACVYVIRMCQQAFVICPVCCACTDTWMQNRWAYFHKGFLKALFITDSANRETGNANMYNRWKTHINRFMLPFSYRVAPFLLNGKGNAQGTENIHPWVYLIIWLFVEHACRLWLLCASGASLCSVQIRFTLGWN